MVLVVAPGAYPVPHSFPRANLAAAFLAVIVAWLATAQFRVPRLMVCLGTISYGIYLWHYPILKTGWLLGIPDPLELVAFVAASILVGWLSWRLIERPALARRPGLARWLRRLIEPDDHDVEQAISRIRAG